MKNGLRRLTTLLLTFCIAAAMPILQASALSGKAPAAPSSLAAKALSDRAVSLTWNDNSEDEFSFYIERKSGSGDYIKIFETDADATRFVDLGLSAGTAYTYRIEALNSIGVSGYSETVSVTTKDAAADDIEYTTAGSWAAPEIEMASQYGLLTDKLHSNFKANITREEFCEIAVRLYENLSGKTAAPTSINPFTDTTNAELLKAYNLGITTGTSADKFSPNNPISRQEICVMIGRTLQAAIPGLEIKVSNYNSFADDSSIDSWAVQYVRYANSKSIMNGVGGNWFDPLGKTTREQGIAIVKRAFEALN